MPASLEARNRLRVIRRLSKGFPDQTAEARLGQIAKIASGEAPAVIPREPMDKTMAQRIAEGQASRSPKAKDRVRPAPKKKPAEDSEPKKRKRLGGRDRKERGGSERVDPDKIVKSEDVNL